MRLGINKVPDYIGKSLSKLLQDLASQNSMVKLKLGNEVSKSNHPFGFDDWLESVGGDCQVESYIVHSIDFIPYVGQAVEVGNHVEIVPYEVTIERGSLKCRIDM